MAQQQQQPLGQQYQQPTTQQFGTGQPPTQQSGIQFDKALPSELRLVLHDTNKLANVAEWCKNQLVAQGPQTQEAIRICDDLASIAELSERLIARDSAFGTQISQALVNVCNEALVELEQYQQYPEIQEVVGSVYNLVDSTQKELQVMGQQVGGQQIRTPQQPGVTGQQTGMTGQPTGQQTGHQYGMSQKIGGQPPQFGGQPQQF
jgi:hypothetical protein